MAVSTGSFNESEHCSQGPPQGNRNMVFSKAVSSRSGSRPLLSFGSMANVRPFAFHYFNHPRPGGGIRQECPVVRHFSTLLPAPTHATIVPALSKISWRNAMQEWRPWLIFIAIFAMKTSETVATSSFLSFRNFGISPIFVVIFLPAFIWHMTKANENPVMTLWQNA